MIVEAPNAYPLDLPIVFLAGGITDCPDWQADVIRDLVPSAKRTILNPRRANFDVRDPSASGVQIRWEHQALRDADLISFWFPAETLCPITLYELGAWSMTDKEILIGVHPEYKRKIDVETQTELVRPDIEIVYDLYDLADQIYEYYPDY